MEEPIQPYFLRSNENNCYVTIYKQKGLKIDPEILRAIINQ